MRRLPQVCRRPCVVIFVGTVTSLEQHRRARRQRARARHALPAATLYFDLRSPFTYLAAERADRLFDGLDWQPACIDVIGSGEIDGPTMSAARARARLLGLPLVWPDAGAQAGREAMRVAALAAELGGAGPFVLAASRLAFCGGFDVDDPEILAEAAAVAGIALDAALRAAGDPRRDGAIEATARQLLAAGADRLPALRVGRRLFCGEDRLLEAAAARAAV